MSQLLQILPRLSDGVKIKDLPVNLILHGIPLTSTSLLFPAICYRIDMNIAYYHQGLPFTADGCIAAMPINATVDSTYPGGIPISSTGRVIFGSDPVHHYNAGVPYTSSNQIAVKD